MPAVQIVLPSHVARRFVLGRQGLWPGRRWQGPAGIVAAMRATEHLQLDPLNIVARSQDLMLHARVTDYQPEAWQQPTYGQRQFFDWGGWLAVRPIEELPYFRQQMQLYAQQAQPAAWAQQHAKLLDEMRTALREAGPVSNRDFAMASRSRVNSYRGRKDSAVALYHLWRTGEAMIHDRTRFERSYDLTERIAPSHLITTAEAQATERFLLLKHVAFHGLHDGGRSYPLPGASTAAHTRRLLTELVAQGLLATVQIEGQRSAHYALVADLPLLEQLLQDRTPAEWRPLASTTRQAVTFLAPLDPVSARGRSLKLFGFDYVWEVYKPVEARRWGYYVLPILWGDALVARADLKLDRATNTLQVLGFWLEHAAMGKDEEFALAFGRGLAELRRFVAADRVDAAGIRPVSLRKVVRQLAAG
jgi:uncharacterized protein YcaQ